MAGVGGKGIPVLFHFVGQLEEKLLAFVIPLKEGFKNKLPLGKIGRVFARIAVGGSGRDTV